MSEAEHVVLPRDGFCECGCGRKTKPAFRTQKSRGNIKGKPQRFVLGHSPRTKTGRPEYIEDERGCWVWQRSRTTAGYGNFMVGGEAFYAHRWYYEQAKGPIPDGLHLDHLCRNPACVNPEHLEAVTNAENCRRGRKAKLTEDDVRQIRVEYVKGRGVYHRGNVRELAERFGVATNTINGIVRGRRWAGVA